MRCWFTTAAVDKCSEVHFWPSSKSYSTSSSSGWFRVFFWVNMVGSVSMLGVAQACLGKMVMRTSLKNVALMNGLSWKGERYSIRGAAIVWSYERAERLDSGFTVSFGGSLKLISEAAPYFVVFSCRGLVVFGNGSGLKPGWVGTGLGGFVSKIVFCARGFLKVTTLYTPVVFIDTPEAALVQTKLVIEVRTLRGFSMAMSSVHAVRNTAEFSHTEDIKKRLKIERNANVDKVFLDHEQYAEMNVPTTYQAPAENSLLEKTGDMRTFMNWYCQKMGKTELTQADLEGQAYEVVKPFYPNVVHLQFQMEECHKMLTDQIDWTNPEGDQVRIDINRPLPLSGPPGHVTIQTQFFFNHDLDYLRYSSKGSGQALLISKMKVARYHDFGLELLVPEHMWIDDVCTYDISASYGISHWWFNRQKFYIDRHTAESSRKVVRTYMCILSVVRIKAYSRYGLQLPERDHIAPKADHQILHDLPKRDSKTCILVTFEDLKCFLELCSPSVTINERSCGSMRFTKFSDGTLTNIMEALDYKVKEYKVNRLNPGMNTRFWTDKDVERSKEFIHAIERRLKTRRIFQNLECFVGGRVRDIDYRLLQRTE
ncbi:hypothetical protein Tco_1400912 [Tanacetum coccineum]